MNIDELENMIDSETEVSYICDVESLCMIKDLLSEGKAAVLGSPEPYLHTDYYLLKVLKEDSTVVTCKVNSLWRDCLIEAAMNRAENTGYAVSPNSPTFSVVNTTVRFSSAIWYEQMQRQSIILAGLGGIGSFAAMFIGRMRPAELIVFDPDTVEEVNMSGQLYGTDCVDVNKAQAIGAILYNTCKYSCNYFCKEYTKDCDTRNIMICGFDNMSARRTFYYNWKKRTADKDMRNKCLFIDGRLDVEMFQIFAIQGDDTRAMEEYENKWLFYDDEAEVTVCSYKQTTYAAAMIASVMTNILINFVANQCNPPFPREVPFFTVYDAERMFGKIER